jgi:hypothetical protein
MTTLMSAHHKWVTLNKFLSSIAELCLRVKSLAVEVLEKIRRSVQSTPPSHPLQLVAKIVQRAAPASMHTATEDVWSKLADLLGLDRVYVRRVCEASPDWCMWLYSTIMGAAVPIPSTAPTADILTLIDFASRRGYKNVLQAVDVKELVKRVADYVESSVKGFGRPGAEARQSIERILKVVRDIHGLRAQPVIEEEVFKRLRSIAQESVARDIAKAVARAVVELPPQQAAERIEQLAVAVRRAQAEAKEKPPVQRRSVQSPEQAKPLRPSATVKQV